MSTTLWVGDKMYVVDDEVRDEFDSLTDQLARATSTITCLWCGAETERDADNVKTMAALALHLLECKDHPLAKRLAEVTEANRWIPVGERKPGKEGAYLIIINSTYVTRSAFIPNRKPIEWCVMPACNVTHWRPIVLPEGE